MHSRFLVFLITGLLASPCSHAQYTEGITVREARDKAWTPEQSWKGIEMDGPYEAQLVASEPLVLDPVEMTWDAKGRCFVADMRDYPLGPAEGQKPLSRIVQLLDPDKNGRYTKSKVFADHVDHVQGLLPYKDGLIATTRTQILFLRDTDGDGVADEIKPLVQGFNPNHSQLQVSAPRWGLDNRVYFNNGLSTGEIYPSANPSGKMKVSRSNLRWDPATGNLEITTGNGQFGGCFDDRGRHFFCSNRNPIMFAVMPHEAVIRNPNAGIAQGWEDIAPPGADGKVYPLQLSHTTSDAHAGTHTAACGLGVYRGDLMPELRGEIFVCEPTAQAVVRYHAEPNGASLKATRVGDHKEFFRSSDEWCRPVNVTTGPDGALYVCDIYRQYIDHARFFPEAFVKSHDLRAGEHAGRIWRVVPKGAKQAPGKDDAPVVRRGKKDATSGVSSLVVRPITAAPSGAQDLVAWLGHENAWQRETAQRLLVEKRAAASALSKWIAGSKPSEVSLLHAAGLLSAWKMGEPSAGSKGLRSATAACLKRIFESPALQAEAYLAIGPDLWGDDLAGIGNLIKSDQPRPAFAGAIHAGERPRRDNAADLLHVLRQFPEDPWLQRAVVSSALGRPGVVAPCFGDLAKGILADQQFAIHHSASKAELIRALAVQTCAAADPMDFSALISVLNQGAGKLLWWKSALLQGLAEGLPKSGGKLGVKSLADFTARPPAQFKESAAEIAALLAQVDKAMTDASAPVGQRVAVIPLLGQRTWEKAEPVMRALLAETQAPEVRTAALAVLRRFSSDKTASLLYELLPKADPTARREIVVMLSSGKTLLDFLQRMDRGEVPRSFIGAEQRWGLQRNANAQIKELAAKLFGTVSSDRAAVIAKYAGVTKMKGDSKKGHEVFKTNCITCHKIRGEGVEIGPDITDVRIKPADALLTDILDPNRICEPRFMAYQVDTKDGRVVAGIVAAETGDNVTLKLAGGVTESVPRSNIKMMKCLDQSLMPLGLEATLNPQQMADLIAFLRGE